MDSEYTDNKKLYEVKELQDYDTDSNIEFKIDDHTTSRQETTSVLSMEDTYTNRNSDIVSYSITSCYTTIYNNRPLEPTPCCMPRRRSDYCQYYN